MIRSGLLEEFDFLKNSGQWVTLAQSPFYDNYLEFLSQHTQKNLTSLQRSEQIRNVLEESLSLRPSEPQETKAQETETKKEGRAVLKSARQGVPNHTHSHKSISAKPVVNTKKTKSNFAILLLVVFLILLILGFYFFSKKPTEALTKLYQLKGLARNVNVNPDITASDLDQKLFEKSEPPDLYLLMKSLSEKLSSSHGGTQDLSYLCLIHYELWPMSNKSIENLTAYMSLISKTNTVGAAALVCKSSLNLRLHNYETAGHLLQTLLLEFPRDPFGHFLMGELSLLAGDLKTAVSYYEKAHQLFPNWTGTSIAAAKTYFDLGEYEKVIEIQRRTQNPSLMTLAVGSLVLGYRSYEKKALLENALDNTLRPSIRARGLLTMAYFYLNENNKTKALEVAKTAYDLGPRFTAPRRFAESIDPSLSWITPSEQETLARADQYFINGNYLAAFAVYKEAHELSSNHRAAYMASLCLWKLYRSSEAIEWAERALPNFLQNPDVYSDLIFYYSEKYEFGLANTMANKASEDLGDFAKIYPPFYEALAQLELKRNNFKGAIDYAQKALDLDGNYGKAITTMVEAHRGTNEVIESYRWASRLYELNKGNLEAHLLYATELARYQGAQSGLDFLQNIINTHPSSAQAYATKANILAQDHQYGKAKEAGQLALQIEAQNKPLLLSMGDWSLILQQPDQALQLYLNAAAIDPSDALPTFKMASVYLANKQPQPALEQLELVERINTHFPLLYFQKARALDLLGRYSDALNALEYEKKFNPRIGNIHILEGEILMKTKQYAKAAEAYQEATKYKTYGADIYTKLAQAYRLSGQPDVALSMLRTGEQKDPSYKELFKEYGALYEMRGEKPLAIRSYQRYLEIAPNAHDRTAIEGRIRFLGGN